MKTQSDCIYVWMLSDVDIIVEYFEFVATEITSNKDEGSVLEAFRRALDHVREQLSHVTLSHSRLFIFADFIIFFTRNVHLAEVCSIVKLYGLLLPTFSLLLVVTFHLVLEVFARQLLLSGIVSPLTSVPAKLSQHSAVI